MSDKELDGLDRLAAAYRKLPRPEPSPALDAAILAQARAAVAKPARRARWPSWVASAAAVTLAVGLAWRVRDGAEPGQPASPFATESATQPVEYRQPADAPGADSDSARLKDAPAKSAERQEQQAEGTRDDQGFVAAPAAQAPTAVPKPAPAEPAPAAGVFARKVAPPPADSRTQGPVDDLAKQSGPEKREADRAEPGSAAAPAAPPAPPPPAAVEEAVVVAQPAPEAAPATAAEPFPQSGAAGAPAPMQVEEKKQANAAGTKEDALAGARRERAASADASRDVDGEAEVLDESATATVTGALGATAQNDDASAEAVALEHIRDLLRDGRRNDAQRALAEFRRRFPDATVPEDLRGLER